VLGTPSSPAASQQNADAAASGVDPTLEKRVSLYAKATVIPAFYFTFVIFLSKGSKSAPHERGIKE
jgi:hypothetical protein